MSFYVIFEEYKILTEPLYQKRKQALKRLQMMSPNCILDGYENDRFICNQIIKDSDRKLWEIHNSEQFSIFAPTS